MELYGVIGWPIKHSLSPAMHNAAFKELGIDAEYGKFEIRPEELEDFILNRKDVVGFNITIPHKVRAKEILEKKFPFDKDAALILQDLYYVKVSGAINTVKRTDDKIEYWNTDVYGFLTSIEKDLKFDAKNKSIMLFGCGGAGRAVITGLSWKNMDVKKIFVYDINKEAIISTKEHFSQLSKDWKNVLQEKIEFISSEKMPDRIQECQLLVNASSVGMREGDGSIVDKKNLHKNLSVFDLVYNRETPLVSSAKSLGLSAIGGLNMLLYQGAESFEFWTGEKAPVEVMKKALLKALKG